MVGPFVGVDVGFCVVGPFVGDDVGKSDGRFVGLLEGCFVGESVGLDVGSVVDGRLVG